MRKRIVAMILFLIIFVLPLFGLSVKAENLTAEDFEQMHQRADRRLAPRLVDDADLLTSEEEAELLEQLDEISEKHQHDIVIVTVDSIGDKTPTEFADDFFDYNGFGMTKDFNGILFLLSMEERDWAISTSGQSIDAFTDAGQSYMIDQFISNISDAKYAKGFKKFVNLCDDYLNQYEQGTPYDYDHLPKKPLAWYWLPTMLIVALMLSEAIVSSMKNQLKSVRRQAAANNYILRDSFELQDNRDLFLYSNVTSTPIPRSSSSGGGGGGSSTHTSSSGSSHGGSSGKF